jgi:TPR repeat protein
MKKLLTALVIIVSLGTAGAVCAQDYQEGLSFYEAGNFAAAFKEWKVLAEQGDAAAQSNLGFMCRDGQGVVQDDKEAVKWFRKSAEQRYAAAQYNLGWMYERGQGVVQDYKEAVKWYRKSAEQGNADAQYSLGFMYYYGQGVVQDYKEAVKWYRKSAEQGNADAQFNLGSMYFAGVDVTRDYEQALKWYRKAEQGDTLTWNNYEVIIDAKRDIAREQEVQETKRAHKAAELGDSIAQYNLGEMYIKGKGVEKDYKEAAKWRCKAAEKGDEKHIKGCLDFVGHGSVETQFKLGKMFQQGQGVAQDDNKAARWICGAAEKGLSEARKSCRKIASSGNAAAQYRLGLLLGAGKGILQDTVAAHMWLNIAAANGWSDAVRQRDKIAKLLSVEQREKSAERAKRCLDSDYKDCEAQAKSWWQKITR